MTAVSLSVLSILLLVQCVINCVCCPCSNSVGRFMTYIFMVILGIAQSVTSIRCNDIAKQWVYSIDAGIFFFLCSTFICTRSTPIDSAT